MLTKIEIHEDYWKSGTRYETTTRWTLWRLAWSLYWRVFLVHAILIILLMSIFGGSCGIRVNPMNPKGFTRDSHVIQQFDL